MSATIGNLNEIATFLTADVYTRNFRPVELKEYVKCGSDILSINPNAQSQQEAFKTERTVDYGVSVSEMVFALPFQNSVVYSTRTK